MEAARDDADIGKADASTKILLWMFVSLGAFLRVYDFAEAPLWGDEYGTWWAVAGGSWSDVWDRSLFKHAQSPLYYLIIKAVTTILPVTTFTLRLPSVLFGIAVVYLAYPLAMKLFNSPRTALIAVAVFAVNQDLIRNSQDGRMYSIALFFAMLSFISFLTLLKSDSKRARAGYVVSTAIAFYMHYYFGAIVVIQLLYLLMHDRSSVSSKSWQLTYGAVLILFLPAAWHMRAIYLRHEELAWISPRQLKYYWDTAFSFLGGDAFALSALVVLLLEFSRWNVDFGRHKKLLILWFSFPFGVFWLGTWLVGVDLFAPRYVLYAAPAGCLITAAALGVSPKLSGAGRFGIRVPVVVFLLAVSLFQLRPSLQTFGAFSKKYNQHWNAAAEAIGVDLQNGLPVLYRSAFIEGRMLARARPDARLVSFVRWPLEAHLGAEKANRIIILPPDLTPDAIKYIDRIYRKASRHKQVVFVGHNLGPYVERFRKTWKFKARSVQRFGGLTVVKLERLPGMKRKTTISNGV